MSKSYSSSRHSRPINLQYIPGQLGYRTRPGRTGLDPMDTYREEGLFLGIVLRQLLGVQVRTRNLLLIVLMLVLGLCLLDFIIVSLAGLFGPNRYDFGSRIPSLTFLVPWGLIGFMSIVNALVNIGSMIWEPPTQDEDEHTE